MLSKLSLLSVFEPYLIPRRTELGHGSNVRGIECEARWMPKTKEFIIHSPTLTASKWVSQNRSATHAAVNRYRARI
jgi:hypothetical protein